MLFYRANFNRNNIKTRYHMTRSNILIQKREIFFKDNFPRVNLN